MLHDDKYYIKKKNLKETAREERGSQGDFVRMLWYSDILSAPLHFLAFVAVKQDQVAGAGQWTVSRSGTCHFQAKAVQN